MAAIAIVEVGGCGRGTAEEVRLVTARALARVTQRHGHRLLFARPLFGRNAWAGQAGILVACNLCGANIRMLVSTGIISGGNEILYKRGGARVSQIFLTDVLQHSNTL